jgi:holo-[acyl-carrier-protein] synthase
MNRIWGIGTDICSIARIARVMSKYPTRFAAKVLHENERHALDNIKLTDKKAQFLAARYAFLRLDFFFLPLHFLSYLFLLLSV